MLGYKRKVFVAMLAAGGMCCATSAGAEELNVIATGVYEHVLLDLIGPFKNETGHVVKLSVTNAGGVIKKLEANELADVVMTSAAGIDDLVAKGRIDKSSKVEVGRMRLGVAIQPGSPVPKLETADAVRTTLISAPHVAYIDPKGGGTSGPFFEKLFERLGVSDELKSRGIPCATGNDIVQALASGRATLGLTQASELIGVKGAQFAGYLPVDLQLVSVYSAGIASNSRSVGAAREFIRFVTGPTGAKRFGNSGWDVGATSH